MSRGHAFATTYRLNGQVHLANSGVDVCWMAFWRHSCRMGFRIKQVATHVAGMCQSHLNLVMEPLLTPKQLANILGLSVQTLYNRRSLGASMPSAVCIGNKVRFRLRDVENWLARQEAKQSVSRCGVFDDSLDLPSKRRGRPTKIDQVRGRRQLIICEAGG